MEPIYEAPSEVARSAAEAYVDEVAASGGGGPKDWKAVCKQGGLLLDSAGSVEDAARSLWQVREDRGLNNLKGVERPYLDTVLHPDLLAYLRDVRQRGLAARCPGPRERRRAKLRPNARRHVDQLYRQIWKDVAKQRVLVVPSAHSLLQGVVASPSDAVDKMLPDRTVAVDKRVVHDQKGCQRAHGQGVASACSSAQACSGCTPHHVAQVSLPWGGGSSFQKGHCRGFPFVVGGPERCGFVRWRATLVANGDGRWRGSGWRGHHGHLPGQLLWVLGITWRMGCVGQGHGRFSHESPTSERQARFEHLLPGG